MNRGSSPLTPVTAQRKTQSPERAGVGRYRPGGAIRNVACSFTDGSVVPTEDSGGQSAQDFGKRGGDLVIVDRMDVVEADLRGRHRQLEVIEHVCPRDAC